MSVDTSLIRNFVVAGHSGSGKTSLCDLMLFKAGAVSRIGKVEEGTSVSDYTDEEKDKASSIYATPLTCDWNSNRLYFMDTPGYGEFIGETIGAFNACGNALIVVNGVAGLEVGSTRAKNLARKLNLPRFIFINRLDGDGADFDSVLSKVQEVYGKDKCVPMTLPIGSGPSLSKVVHILRDREVPPELEDDVAIYREQLLDIVAESDEELMERYLGGEEMSEEEISRGLHEAVHTGSIVPVFCGSVEKDIGICELMNGIVNLFMPPLSHGQLLLQDDKLIDVYDEGDGLGLVFKSIQDPFVGQLTCFRVLSGRFTADSEVFNISTGGKEKLGSLFLLDGKTQTPVDEVGPGAICAVTKLKNTHVSDTFCTSSSGPELHRIDYPEPAMTYSINPERKGDEEKVAQGLNRLIECDQTLSLTRHPETHEAILSGMGELHINNAIKKLRDSFKVEVILGAPKIAYRETITGSAESTYRHKKQTGGHGQFAEVSLKVVANPDGFEFENKIVGGAIPKNYIPAVEKGLEEAMIAGPLAGCTVENIKVTVYDGKHHAVDSSEMAFKVATKNALFEAMNSARPILLEPIMKLSITVPDDYMGDVTGDMNHKRGRILGIDLEDGLEVITAEVPKAELSRYATELRSMTHGRGAFEMSFERYEPVPEHIAQTVIAEFQKSTTES